MLIITAIICRVMFRYGNKPIEEGQNIFWKFGTVKPKPWTRKQERIYHWRHAVGWMGNFIFFSVGLWYMSAIALCYGRKQTDIMLEGWLTSTCISWCSMKPSNPHHSHRSSPYPSPLPLAPPPHPYPSPYPSPLPLSPPLTRFIMEPGFILVLVTLPCICNNQYVDTCNDRLNDIGCDVSMCDSFGHYAEFAP